MTVGQGAEWREGLVTIHDGEMIAAVEENGRKFFAVNLHKPDRWAVRQEFCSVADARRYIDQYSRNLP